MSILFCQADAQLIPLADKSVHMCVTSPPYWGLRRYSGQQMRVWGGDPNCDHEWDMKSQVMQTGGKTKKQVTNRGVDGSGWEAKSGYCHKCDAWLGCLGLEPHPDQYISNMVTVAREVYRVLRDDGTFWLNLGDSYIGGGRGGNRPKMRADHSKGIRSNWKGDDLYKPKDLAGIPWRVALALHTDGWWLRSDVIWHKTNPMPNPVRDRPVKGHEYVFLFTKSYKYFYDIEATRVPNKWEHVGNVRLGKRSKNGGSPDEPVQGKGNTTGSFRHFNPAGRNRRTVWTMATRPFRGAHFATFPPDLVEIPIKAGTSEYGVCSVCGAPWKRMVRTKSRKRSGGSPGVPYENRGVFRDNQGSSQSDRKEITQSVKETVGWKPTCKHDAPRVPATVLDPFSGAGTTGLVCQRLGLNYIGMDLSREYSRMAQKRLIADISEKETKEKLVVELYNW